MQEASSVILWLTETLTGSRMFLGNKNDEPNDDGLAHHTSDHFLSDLTREVSARASRPPPSARSRSPQGNASSQLCKTQGKKFHPDQGRQSPYALKHEV